MRIFCVVQGRTRVCAPRKAGQEGVLSVRRNRKPAENAVQLKKDHLWMDINWISIPTAERDEPIMIIGLDVGGTHTDVVLLEKDRLIKDIKVPTDPDDLFNSVLTGLNALTADVDKTQIKRLVLSTTLTTNAIVQRKIAPVGMIVTGGPGINPQFFRTNDLFYVVSGAIDHRGREIEPVDRNKIEHAAAQLKQSNIHHVGVVGKFGIRNPAHELKIAEILENSFDKIFLGHQISGNLNFPRRIATTYLNAAVYPIHKDFFESIKKSLEQKGLAIPIHLLKADGGTMSFESSIDSPDQTILSGPAASVMGATPFASQGDSLVIDVGGTSTDMALLINGVPVLNPLGIHIGAFQTLTRALETRSIGLGGDSSVTVVDGKLRIGPERFGPAMAYGGPAPTPTDALVVLGEITDGDRSQSENGINSVAKELALSPEELANRILDDFCKTILFEADVMIKRVNSKPVYTVHELQEGYRIKPHAMSVLGGPAPHFAKRLAIISDFRVAVVPKWKVANAIGAALARTTCEVSLFADTQQGIAFAPEENFSAEISKGFSKQDAIQQAFDLLRIKAIQKGAQTSDLEMEVIEDQAFNMVRGFHTAGQNIRVKVQVKPGLIQGYETIANTL